MTVSPSRPAGTREGWLVGWLVGGAEREGWLGVQLQVREGSLGVHIGVSDERF